jgi:hypothetical protein
MSPDIKIPSYLSSGEKKAWKLGLEDADRHNILCHCRDCDYEWIASTHTNCDSCRSSNVEHVSCWQFPDD